MAEKGESSDEEPTIAEDVVVTKYKMAGDMCNSEPINVASRLAGCMKDREFICRQDAFSPCTYWISLFEEHCVYYHLTVLMR